MSGLFPTECEKAGKHLQPCHLNRGRKAHVWLCMACGNQIGGQKLEEKERRAVTGEAMELRAKTQEKKQMAEIKRCKLCKKPMRFVKNETGAVIPLDAVAPVYEVRNNLLGEETAYRVGESIMVSHWATCPHANNLSSSRRK